MSIKGNMIKFIHEKENIIYENSITTINNNEILIQYYKYINKSAEIIKILSTEHINKNEAELVIQLSGIRIFNSIFSSLNLMLTGYYQSSLSLIRDIFEIALLIDFFHHKPDHILKWANATRNQLLNDYSPSKIRKELHSIYKIDSSKRSSYYKDLCNFGTHFSPNGTFMLANQNNLATIGPFFNEEKLIRCIEELCININSAYLYFSSHFNDLSPKHILLKNQHLCEVENFLKLIKI
ncbi:MAG: hypothetical protein GYA62_00350 [Bacteroidales bacterium]|nr:hypothetical protein [Bacteroidales bacterium]